MPSSDTMAMAPSAGASGSARDAAFAAAARRLGVAFDGDVKVGGRYAPCVRDGDTVHVAGQIPRVGDAVAVTGRAGADVPLERAQHAAAICALRALALLQRELGTLEAVRALPRLRVYVQCADGFTMLSEVADGASDLLAEVLGAAGRHARTSVGVFQLPKNATVELDLTATAQPLPAAGAAA